MLKRLKIHNVALVDELELEFGPGLNVITGETGAGKSVLVGAIALTLGERAHPDVVKDDKAMVWATFSDSLSENGAVPAEIVLHREVRPDGRTRARIGEETVTIAALREEGSRRVELTGQREGASLLDPETHLDHIDRFAGLAAGRLSLLALYDQWQALKSELSSLESKIRRMDETEELARFQLHEIESFDPKPGEDDELESEIRLLESAETLIHGLSEAVEALDQGEDPVSDRLAAVAAKIEDLATIDRVLEQPATALNEALDILRQATLDLANRRDEIQLDPERLEELRTRHGHLVRLMRKYGGSLPSLFAEWDRLRTRETSSADLRHQRDDLRRRMQAHLRDWEVELQRISTARAKVHRKMQTAMEEGLRSVGVEHPRFLIVMMPDEGEPVEFPEAGKRKVGPYGWDRCEFHISFNPGHEPKALQRVASGGELSRMMLLLRGLTPPEGLAPVLIFDEVDTGISGRTARQVGLRLKELAKTRQVILVTHLPQIASLADRHIRVEKWTDRKRTEVRMTVVPVGGQEQVDEIARLLGGEHVNEASRAAARDLIQLPDSRSHVPSS